MNLVVSATMVDEDVVMKYWPTVVDMKLLRDCTSCFEISGDAPAIIMENADDWIADYAEGLSPWLHVGDAVVSWGALALVPYPDICRAFVLHACSEDFYSGDILDRNANALEKNAAICTWVRFENVGMITFETYLAQSKTEVKLIRDLAVVPDIAILTKEVFLAVRAILVDTSRPWTLWLLGQ